MKAQRILIPARTVADWGGLHEWVVDAAADLLAAGHEVTVVGGPGLFEERSRAAGAGFLAIDWDRWEEEVDRIADTGPYDIVFAHAPQARMLALKLPKWPGSRTHVMVHGAYHDYIYTWADRVDSIAAASPCLVDFLTRIGKVEPWKIDMIPNGVADHVFDLPPEVARRAPGGRRGPCRHGLAPRPGQDDADRRRQGDPRRLRPPPPPISPGSSTCSAMVRCAIATSAEFRRFAMDHPGVEVVFHGWVPPEEVPRRMNSAVIGLVSGMGGVRTLAAGALCIGVGARGSVGVQVGANLRAGVWTRLRDHGTPQFTPHLDHRGPRACAASRRVRGRGGIRPHRRMAHPLRQCGPGCPPDRSAMRLSSERS